STALLLMIYAVNRYIIELFRGDLLRGSVGTYSTSQFISFWTFTAGAVLMAYAYIAKRPVWRPGAPESGDGEPSAVITA
ncbi:MAG: prolipoprotein diacylglyceryl transferase, partial [Deltaproteobacteria bacterium]|nr:prolipoprotein diacylglyceryl transferase [Deltaproteobacteria bacterium]